MTRAKNHAAGKSTGRKPAPRKGRARKPAQAKSAHARGRDAERLAALFLRLKGYSILARRYRTYMGEIDIVARRYGMIVFVEVKHRRTTEKAAEAINRINQSRVRRAAELYLMKHTEYTVFESRFDAIIMAPRRLPQHIPDAF